MHACLEIVKVWNDSKPDIDIADVLRLKLRENIDFIAINHKNVFHALNTLDKILYAL